MSKIIGDPDELITAVKHTARSDAHNIGKNADKRAEEIRNEANERAQRNRKEIVENAKERAEKVKRQQSAKLTYEQKRKFFQEREKFLDEVWRKAEEKLRSLTENEAEYLEVLKRLVILSVEVLGPGEHVLKSDPKGHELLNENYLKNWSREAGEKLQRTMTFELSSDPLDTWGGLIVSEKNSRRQVNATFAERLKLAKSEIRKEIFETLVK